MGLTEPLIGWRAWRVALDERDAYLQGVTHHYTWPVGERMVAQCTECQKEPFAIEVPNRRHECGMYGFWSQRGFVSYMVARAPIVVGYASYWGKIVQHQDGFRAQYAYPHQLWLLPQYITFGQGHEFTPLSDRTIRMFTSSLRRYGVEVDVASKELLDLVTADLWPRGPNP